ncbi:MAG: hypothetical protein U9N78_04240 [Actinomycetota bacterium]|nr:hypothetical protein [Actinomycetota bacterium]
MRLRFAIVVGLLFTLLLALPVSGARFTDTTSNDGNSFTFGTAQPIRSTTYRVTFSGAYHTLTLNQELAENYFVLLRGSADPDVPITTSTTTATDGATEDTALVAMDASADYVRVVGDPSGGPGNKTAANELELGRYSDAGTWWGQVTVIESLDRHDTAGFRLLSAQKVSLTGAGGSIQGSWRRNDEGQIGLYGGSMGGGMTVDGADHANGWARIWPENGQIHVQRTNPAHTANFTIYEVQWGSEWTIQHIRVQGNNGGSGVDTPNEYDTAKLPIEVSRAQTFVLAYGTTTADTPGAGWEGQIYTLGNGHPVNAKSNRAATKENEVAVGSEYPVRRDAEVYVHTHPRLQVDHRFGSHGSIPSGTDLGFTTVDAPLVADVRIGASTGTLRFPILSNSSTGTDPDDPQPIIWSRHSGSTTVSWARNETVSSGAYWLQSVDFGEIWR